MLKLLLLATAAAAAAAAVTTSKAVPKAQAKPLFKQEPPKEAPCSLYEPSAKAYNMEYMYV